MICFPTLLKVKGKSYDAAILVSNAGSLGDLQRGGADLNDVALLQSHLCMNVTSCIAITCVKVRSYNVGITFDIFELMW